MKFHFDPQLYFLYPFVHSLRDERESSWIKVVEKENHD